VETLYRTGLSNAVSATVLALVVACLGRVLGRRPAILHCLWLLVLLKLVTPSFYEVSVPWPESASTTQENASAPEVVLVERDREDDLLDDPLAESACSYVADNAHSAYWWPGDWSSIDWMRLASLIWIAGAVTTLAVSIARIRRFQRLLREARPADDDTQEWVDELAASLGVERSPSVWWITGKLSPMIWSLGWRPRLILPTELWKGLDKHQRDTLIIHELAHLRRGDHHLRFFELLVTALYWWHPVLWWARQALRDVEEQCCDAWVVWALPDAARSYAETLLETLDFLNQSDLAEPLLASGFGKVQHLRKRLTMIMSGTTPRLLGIWGTLGSLGLAVVLLPVNATWAQKTEEKKEIRVIVKADDDASDSNDTVTAVVAAVPVEATESVKTIEGVKKEQFSFVFDTDDSASVIAADSFDDAIKKLNEQIKEIDKKSPQSDKDKARQKALTNALKELKGAAGKIKDSDESGDKVKSQKNVRKVVVRRLDDDKKISPEAKAEIDKALAKVKALAKELQSKQNELREAQRNLSQLQGKVRALALTARVNVDGKKAEGLTIAPIAPMGRMGVMTPSNTVERRVTVRRDGDAGQKRIDDLEKKLEKLLEEVASLKKDRAK
jgi:bla regulator protein blaR1